VVTRSWPGQYRNDIDKRICWCLLMAVREISIQSGYVSKATKPPLFGRKLAAFYKGCALQSFNAILLFLLVNGILALVFLLCDSLQTQAGPAVAYPESSLAAVYPNLDRNERALLWHESWSRSLVPDEYTHFKEAPYSGKYVNITKAGYRKSTGQAPWPPEKDRIVIFVFGGSTTFGYGLPDEQTLPSYLQEAFSQHAKKTVAVYNFGVGYYYLTQERIRFEKLLLDGYIPDIAIFVDGINEEFCVHDKPWNRKGVGTAPPQGREALTTFLAFLRSLPITRAAHYVKQQFLSGDEGYSLPSEEAIQLHLRKFWVNQTMIRALGREFGVTPVFVWQPSPFYKYDLQYHLFAGKDRISPLYTAMAAQVRDRPPPDDFLWCAEIQEQERECLYVDRLHYNAKFAKRLADTICSLCLERRLLARHGIGLE
jgi:hypothetical protein